MSTNKPILAVPKMLMGTTWTMFYKMVDFDTVEVIQYTRDSPVGYLLGNAAGHLTTYEVATDESERTLASISICYSDGSEVKYEVYNPRHIFNYR